MKALSPTGWVMRAKREWLRFHLAEPELAFILEPPPEGEWVVLDCETTGLDQRRDRVVSVAAVRIVGNRLMTSQRLELVVRSERALSADSVRVHLLRESDVAQGVEGADAMRQLLRFVGSRPLVGYYLEFDVAMLNHEVWPLLGFGLPQRKIEVSAMYHDWKSRSLPAHERGVRQIDLSFAAMMGDLGLPQRAAHDPLNDAVMAGLAFVKLRALLGQA